MFAHGQVLASLTFSEDLWRVRVPRGAYRERVGRVKTVGLKRLDSLFSSVGVQSISRIHLPFPEWQLKHKRWSALSRALDSTFLLKLGSKHSAAKVIAELLSFRGVRAAERNGYFCPAQSSPRDWFPTVRVPGGAAPRGNRGAVVAMIDSGAQLDHSELQPYLYLPSGCDVVDVSGLQSPFGRWVSGGDQDTPDDIPADDLGHGTHIAGIIGGHTCGIATGVTLLPVRALATTENMIGERTALGKSDDIARAIRFAVDQGARVINMSYTNATADSSGGTYAERKALEYAVNRGCFLAAAMGNQPDGSDADPATQRDVCGVGAINPGDDALWPYSQTGSHCDLCAPGVDIVAARLGGGLTPLSGTSMATAVVSGVAAVILSTILDRGLPMPGKNELAKLLTGSARKVWPGFASSTNQFGYGCVDLEAALSALLPS